MILNNLDVKSVLNCRLVNQFWGKRAAAVLKRRPAWIAVDVTCDAFARLYKCVSKSEDFPFPGLKLNSPNREQLFKGFPVGTKKFYKLCPLTVNAPKYFSKFRKIHTHVAINVKLPRDVDLMENVLAKLPNTKFLKFLQLSKGRGADELELEQFSMPKLTTLYLAGPDAEVNEPVLRAIVNASPSLEKIKHVRLGLVPIFWEDREKVGLVSSMIIEDQMDESISHKLVATPPSFKTLTISRGEAEPINVSTRALTAVLVGSQNTLQKLVLNWKSADSLWDLGMILWTNF